MSNRTRREWLRFVGGAGLLGVAGCGSAAAAELDEEETAAPPEKLTLQAKLTPDDGDSDDHFGESVAVSSDGSTALISARDDENPNGDGAGSAYVFGRSGGSWTQQAKLAPDDGDSYDYFGYSVAVSSDGSTALIGARGDEDPNGDDAGSAYVFDRAGGSWTQQAKLTPDDGDSLDNFGESVTVSSDGTTALIGAYHDEDPNGRRAGSAYVFDRAGGSWTQQAKLAPDDGDSDDEFGDSVTVSSDGSTALIGARNDEDPNGVEAGSAYVFGRSDPSSGYSDPLLDRYDSDNDGTIGFSELSDAAVDYANDDLTFGELSEVAVAYADS